MGKEFDIALSFAGENRNYVDDVAEKLKADGVSVFYDVFYEVDLWGKDLYQYFNDLYKNRAIYSVIFISKYYHDKLWAKHELKSAQSRAFSENYEYLLPVRFDDTKIPGINDTTGYIDISKMDPGSLVKKIEAKLLSNDYFDKSKIKDSTFTSQSLTNGWDDTTTYFHFELKNAFPDIIGNTIINNKDEIHHRLSVLLRNPSAIGEYNKAHDPIWWFRGSSASFITRYKVVDKDICLLNENELDIEEIYVYNSGAYWQDYIYVKVKAQQQCGLNNYTPDEVEQRKQKFGYSYEAFGLYKNQVIKPIEVENGGYVRNGLVHPIEKNDAEIRYRYLTPYSFFISAKANPLNTHNIDFQRYIETFCNNNVDGKVSIDEFNSIFRRIGRIDQKYDYQK